VKKKLSEENFKKKGKQWLISNINILAKKRCVKLKNSLFSYL